jgi:hypothetical protein
MASGAGSPPFHSFSDDFCEDRAANPIEFLSLNCSDVQIIQLGRLFRQYTGGQILRWVEEYRCHCKWYQGNSIIRIIITFRRLLCNDPGCPPCYPHSETSPQVLACSAQRPTLDAYMSKADIVLLSFHELQFEQEFSVLGHLRYFAGDDPLQPEPLTIHVHGEVYSWPLYTAARQCAPPNAAYRRAHRTCHPIPSYADQTESTGIYMRCL